MKLIGRKTLNDFKQAHTETVQQVNAWEAEIHAAKWKTHHDLKSRYPSASILPENKVVFNIKGNKYRVRVLINYITQIVLVDKTGTHKEYMKWGR